MFSFGTTACAPEQEPGPSVERIIATEDYVEREHTAVAMFSGDGRFVVASSHARDIVPGHEYPAYLLYDVEEKTTEVLGEWQDLYRRSIDISGDGRLIARKPPRTLLDGPRPSPNLEVIDRETGEQVFLLEGDPDLNTEPYTKEPRFSADGRYLLYDGTAWSHLGEEYLELEWANLMRVDLETGIVQLAGLMSPIEGRYRKFPERSALSDDGRFSAWVLIEEANGRPLHLAMMDIETGEQQYLGVVGLESEDMPSALDFNADGSILAFGSKRRFIPEDDNGASDVYLYHRLEDRYERFETTIDGRPLDGFCRHPNITPDGRYVAMVCAAENLDDLITFSPWGDVYVWDRECDTVARVTVNINGTGGADNQIGFVELSDDGRSMVFTSWAGNLVPNDRNSAIDVFLAENPLAEDCQ